MDQPETPLKNTTRKRCSNGTRWVKEANRCMTSEEKTEFMANLKESNKEKKRIFLEQDKQRKTRKKRSPLKPATEPVTEPVAEPATEPVTEPVTETVDMYATQLDVTPEMEQEQSQQSIYPGITLKVKTKKEPENEENQVLLENELQSYMTYETESKTNDEYYPDKNDPNFNIKIAEKKEFNDLIRNESTKQDDVEAYANKECKSGFQILPHQQFVKSFMSIHTPFNSLLLYHELGTGKTCSAIGVAEETRKYMKRSGILRKTVVVGNHNILSNFRLQLFDPNKLKEDGRPGLWSLDTCVGNSLIEEVNEFHYEGKTREQVTKQINHIIDTYYDFVGYRKLANLIESRLDIDLSKIKDIHDTDTDIMRKKKLLEIKRVKKTFDNTLFIIDEAHNILQRDENKKKRAAKMLIKLSKYCDNLKLLLLSATPMYNTHQELVWLVNLMNINDRRPTIKTSDVFLPNGDFVPGKKEKDIVIEEDGRTMLKRKLIGYVSYVRGENPYVFPFRIYPSYFAESEHLFSSVSYPTHVMTDVPLNGGKIEHLDLYINRMGSYQQIVYEKLVEYTVAQKRKLPNFEESSTFAIKWLLPLISSTNMTYPQGKVVEVEGKKDKPENITEYMLSVCHGAKGLNNIMVREEKQFDEKTSYVTMTYKDDTLEMYGRIFQEPHLSKYSAKISKICKCIRESKGIVLIYSNYLDAGLIPMALALEEMGMERYCRREYMPSTMLTSTNSDKKIGKYIMITGSMTYSPSNKDDIEQVVQSSNKNGENIRVVLVSGSGSEGIDLKNVRQVHIIEPWYNLNRIEQVIGRAVRNKSHCALPFAERNVEIYMHTSYYNTKEETVDMYLYRVAERKSIQIGVLSRLLKETAVDCLIYNNESQNYTKEHLNTKVSLTLSTKNKQIEYEIGDKPYSHTCDYMENCSYTCSPTTDMQKIEVKKNTYHTDHLQSNHYRILKRLRQLFRDKVYFNSEELIRNINVGRPYMLEEIFYTLSQMIGNPRMWLVNKGRTGYLIESNNTYAFQSSEYTDVQASVYERKKPLDLKRTQILYEIPEDGTYIPFNDEKQTQEIENSLTENRLTEKSPTLFKPNVPKKTHKGFLPENSSQSILDPLTQIKTIPKAKNLLDIFYSKFEKISKAPRKIFNRHIDRKEDTWYICVPLAIKSLMKDHNASLSHVYVYCISHIIETLSFTEKLALVEYCYHTTEDFSVVSLSNIQVKTLEKIEETDLITCMKYHFQKQIHFPTSDSEKPHIFICQNSANNHYVYENEKWIKASIAYRENYTYVKQWIKQFNVRDSITKRISNDFPELNYTEKDTCVIGFMNLIKKSETDGFDFKIKNVLNASLNNKGVRCSNKIKSEILKFLNDTLSQKGITTVLYDGYKIDGVEFETRELVCMYELLLRHFTETTELLWFMNMENSIATNFQELVYDRKESASGNNILIEKTKN